jgi:hypothetical protein
MYQTNKPAEKRFLVLPGQLDGFHGWMVLTNACGGFSSNQDEGRGVHSRPQSEAVSESIVGAWGMMADSRCGVGPRFEAGRRRCRRRIGLGVGRPCLTLWWRSWVAVAVTGEMTYQVSADQLAVVEAAGKDAAQVRLIGGCGVASFKEIAAGLISRAGSTEVLSGCLDVERERRATTVRPAHCAPAAGIGTSSTTTAGSSREPARVRSTRATRAFAGRAGVLGPVVTTTVQDVSTGRAAMLTPRGSTRSRGGGRRLRRRAGVVTGGRGGGRRGDRRRPAAGRPGLGRSGDAPRVGRRAGDGSGR